MHPTNRERIQQDNEDRATPRSLDRVDMSSVSIPLTSRLPPRHTRLRIRTNIVGQEQDITIHTEVTSIMRAGDCHKNQHFILMFLNVGFSLPFTAQQVLRLSMPNRCAYCRLLVVVLSVVKIFRGNRRIYYDAG